MQNNHPLLKAELISQATVYTLSRELAHKIQDSDFKPEVIVCIARGGYVPARLLCDFLDIYDLSSIRIKHYTGSDKAEQAVLMDPLTMDVRGKQVLLVDDIDDTGETLQVALDYLKELYPAMVKVAVLHHKMISSLKPDYYAKKIVQWRWLIYPWAVVEDIRGFVKKMQPQPSAPEEAIQRIEQSYRIRVSKHVMQDVFRLL